jgi:hypothetical protein
MKKKALKKLGLHRETLRSMDRREIEKAAGASFCPCSDSCDVGTDPTCVSCFTCTC